MGLAIVFGVLGILALLIATDTDSGFMLAVAIGLFVCALVRGITYDPHPTPQQKQEQQVQQNDSANQVDAGNEDDGAPADVNASNSDQNQAKADDQKKDDTKKFDWQSWADSNVKGAVVSCNPDGIQVYVTGSQNTDDPNSGPDAIAIWTRVHKDGTPFTCEEDKDPKEEPKR